MAVRHEVVVSVVGIIRSRQEKSAILFFITQYSSRVYDYSVAHELMS